MRTTELGPALRWLTDILAERDVPYQVVGGLAARLYGARRPLVDIDLYVPDAALEPLAETLHRHLIRAPLLHRDEHWDITFMQMAYGGHTFELGGADSARLYDRERGGWRPAEVDFGCSVQHELEGVPLLVMPRTQLIAYKAALGRAVDIQDVREMRAVD